MKLYTIGFTKKTASEFFGRLNGSGATTLVDIRLNNVSQLAGFTKRDDLEYFARELCGMAYHHELGLAPSGDFLRAYRNGDWTWAEYEEKYISLIRERRVEEVLVPARLDSAVLLCSEATPERCHRRLAAEYLAKAWHDVEVIHL